MHVLTRLDGDAGHPNRIAILDDRFADRDGPDGDFVPRRHIATQLDPLRLRHFPEAGHGAR